MNELVTFSTCVFAAVAVAVWTVASCFADPDEDRLRERLRNRHPSSRDGASLVARLRKSVAEFLQAAAGPFMPSRKEAQSLLRRQLGHAGIYSPAAIRLVIGCKVILLIAGVVGGTLAGWHMGNLALGLSLGGLIGYVVPGLWVRNRIRRQQRALQNGLPDALDLLVVCIEAGLTIDAAMQRVGQELALAHPRLARELELTHMETRVGLPRADALKNLGMRTGNQAVRTLTTMLIQAERFGTSVADALRVHADTLRVARQHSAEERAAKASVKLTFPVVLFIFPAVLIVLIGPALIGLFRSALFAE